MLKIYGHPLSSPTNKVRMCANAAGAGFEFVIVDLSKGEHKQPPYLAINPVGQIPAIDDDGFKLFESTAIIKYLARKYGPGLYPDDVRQQALIDQWCDFVGNQVHPGYGRLNFNKVIAPAFGMPVSDAAIKEGGEMLERSLPVAEAQLEKSKFLAGDALTIADICLLAAMDPNEGVGMDLKKYPKLSAWRENLRSRDFYTKVHKHYGEGIFS